MVSLFFATQAVGGECDTVLVGIHNKDFIKSSSESSENFLSLLDDSQASSYSEASSFAGSVGLKLPIEGVPVDLRSSISSSDSKNGSWSKKFRQYVSSSESNKQQFERIFESANRDVTDAWRECMTRNVGIRVSADSAGLVGEDGLYINVQWAPPLISIPEPTIERVDYDHSMLELVSPPTLRGIKIPYAQALPITFRRISSPEKQTHFTVFTDNKEFQRRIILAGTPPKFVPPPLPISRNKRDFNGDRIVDLLDFQGNTFVVKLGDLGTEVTTTPSLEYNTRIGVVLTGDFDGDGCTDIVHVLNLPKQAMEQYAHVHISNCAGGFIAPSKFYFSQAANSPDYDSARGHWNVLDCRTSQPERDRQSVLVHYADTTSTHYWIPDVTGRQMRINRDCNG